MKVCAKCGVEKPLEEFNKRTQSKDGKHYYCKACANTYTKRWYAANKQRHVELNAVWARANREKMAIKSARQRGTPIVGLRPGDYARMMEAQQGRCAICGTTAEVLCIDHCHNTGVVRGLLCHKCNKAIGLLQDDFDVLLSAVMYLRRSTSRSARVAA